MKAFNGDKNVKEQVLQQIEQAIRSQKINRRTSLIDALGLIDRSAFSMVFSEVADKLQIPVVLLHMQDAIFDGLSAGRAQNWYRELLSAIEPGADLTVATWKFAVWMENEVAALVANLPADLDCQKRQALNSCASRVPQYISSSCTQCETDAGGSAAASAVQYASFAFAYGSSAKLNSQAQRTAQRAACERFATALISFIKP